MRNNSNDPEDLRGFSEEFAKCFVIPQITLWQSMIDPNVKIGSGIMAEYYESMRSAVKELKKKFSSPYYYHNLFPHHDIVITTKEVEMLKGIIGDNYNHLKNKIEQKKSLGVSFMNTEKEEEELEKIETYLTYVVPNFADSKEKSLWIPFEKINLPNNSNKTIIKTDALVAYDVFISHASEDKNNFVNPLVEALAKKGVKVWYDNSELQWGDSLRSSIDKGLSLSRYGIVVLSKSFLSKKKWTEHELDGLFALEKVGKKVILPIWHDISREDILQYSPSLADRLAKRSDVDSIQEIANSIITILNS